MKLAFCRPEYRNDCKYRVSKCERCCQPEFLDRLKCGGVKYKSVSTRKCKKCKDRFICWTT
jgi:hypothetical protein